MHFNKCYKPDSWEFPLLFLVLQQIIWLHLTLSPVFSSLPLTSSFTSSMNLLFSRLLGLFHSISDLCIIFPNIILLLTCPICFPALISKTYGMSCYYNLPHSWSCSSWSLQKRTLTFSALESKFSSFFVAPPVTSLLLLSSSH